MSYITTDTLFTLYNNVLKPGAHEHHSTALVTHIINKIEFHYEKFVNTAESPPTVRQDGSLRRADVRIATLYLTQHNLRIILICEVKPASSSVYTVESEVQEGCQICVTADKEDVWGLTVHGTKWKIINYTKQNRLNEITGFIDVGSPEAQHLRNAFAIMRKQFEHIQYVSFLPETDLAHCIVGHNLYSSLFLALPLQTMAGIL